jgi:glycosyltransferase involved in cell wall biosynthesis
VIRVAFANRSGDETGGAEESLALLIGHMPHDFELHAILFGDGHYAERLRQSGVAVHVLPIADALLKSKRERPSIRGAFEMPAAIARVCALLRRERIDVVHTNTVKSHLIVAPAARLAGAGSVLHLRDIVDGPGRTLIRAIGSHVGDARIAISRAVAQWYGLEDTTVIANPVDLSAYDALPTRDVARARLNIPNDGLPLVSIVGRINRWKQHDVFLRVMRRVAEKQPIRCAIIGEARFRDEDFVPELHDLATHLGIADRTHFIPWQEDITTAYAATDVLCNCSLREPFGRTMIEAAAAAVPSIAFDDGGAPDIIMHGRTGYLVTPGDEPAFANALSLLLDDNRRSTFGRAAKAAADRFAAPVHANAVASILRAHARTYL